MNGIIHNATHANSDLSKLPNEKEMFLDIFKYIERVFDIIKPKQVFFMAVDGILKTSLNLNFL
jgi:5'-3' exoribonuclease 1